MRLQFLQQNIGRDLRKPVNAGVPDRSMSHRDYVSYLEDDVRDKEDCQRRVIFRSINDVEILLEVEEGGITDVDPVRRETDGQRKPKILPSCA